MTSRANQESMKSDELFFAYAARFGVAIPDTIALTTEWSFRVTQSSCLRRFTNLDESSCLHHRF